MKNVSLVHPQMHQSLRNLLRFLIEMYVKLGYHMYFLKKIHLPRQVARYVIEGLNSVVNRRIIVELIQLFYAYCI
jgi:hypothetical protein